MEKRSFSIPKISCDHCIMTIKNELIELVGVKQVEGDTQNKTITVEWESPTTLNAIRETLNEINYPVS